MGIENPNGLMIIPQGLGRQSLARERPPQEPSIRYFRQLLVGCLTSPYLDPSRYIKMMCHPILEHFGWSRYV